MMGTVPCTGPGTHRVSLEASTRCRPDEARKPFGQIPPRNSGRPRNLSPHPSFSHTHSRWRCDKEQSPINPETGQIREKKKITFCELPTRGHHTLRTERCRTRTGLRTGGRRRVSEIESSRVASSRPASMQDHCRRPHSQVRSASSGGRGAGPRSVRREDVCALLQDELHHLVLEHHGHGHAGFLCLGPQQRGPEHYGHALHGHAVLFSVLDHPAVGVGWNQGPELGGGVRGRVLSGPPPHSPAAPRLTCTGAGRAAALCRGWGRAASAPGSEHSGCAGPGPAALGRGRVRGRERRGRETEGADFQYFAGAVPARRVPEAAQPHSYPIRPTSPRRSLMAAMNWGKCEKGKRGSGSSRKKSFRAPVITWTSSQRPSSRSRRSSAERGEGRKRRSASLCALGPGAGTGDGPHRGPLYSAASGWWPGFH